jgi:uncharacterized Ntn-hydrolase superfamily protein
MCGRSYAVQGNLLAGARVVEAMADAYEAAAALPFACRLVRALVAGDEAGGDRRGRQSAALKIWRGSPPDATLDGVVADLRVDDAARPVHRLERLLAPYWLEYGRPADDAIPLTGAHRARVAGALRVPVDEVDTALERWASEQNLERRLVPGGIDSAVLEVLESGAGRMLHSIASSPPQAGWPA